jgi:hypothetical protein
MWGMNLSSHRRSFRYVSNTSGNFWVRVVIVIVLATFVVIGTSKRTGLTLPEAATTIASIITATAFLLAYQTLRTTHEWNRRHYTVELSSRWNTQVRVHLAFLEHEFPQFFAVPNFVRTRIYIGLFPAHRSGQRIGAVGGEFALAGGKCAMVQI